MAKRIKNMWMLVQGSMTRPLPSGSVAWPISPTARETTELAKPARPASSTWRVVLMTRTVCMILPFTISPDDREMGLREIVPLSF